MTAVVVLLLTLLCYLLGTSVWSVCFGSLSKIPGPKLAAATRLVLIWHKGRGNVEHWRLSLHRRYGDVVRVTPTDVSFADGTVWRDIYGFAPGTGTAKMAKDTTFYGSHADDPSLINADDIQHSRQRKCFSNAFSDRALREQEPLILRYVNQLVSNVKRTTTTTGTRQKLDLAKQYNFATFDIMGDLAFGEPLGCLAKGEYIPWMTAVFGTIRIITMFGEINRSPLAKKLLTMVMPASLNEKRQKHRQFSADRVNKRLAEKTDRADIWHFVLASEGKNLVLSRDEMAANAGIFMIAGTETSATLLSALTYFLLMNPSTMKRVTQEIRSEFASADEIRVQRLSSLEYLTACIQEAFRMHPPVPSGLPRITPPAGAEILGYRIPGGTLVHVHQYSTYRNPNNFAHPDTFLPQRWLPKKDIQQLECDGDLSMGIVNPADFDNDKKSSLQPFSIGPRNCIGQNLAWLEIRLIIAHLLWHFDLEIVDESKGWDVRRVFTLWESKPLEVIATSVEQAVMTTPTTAT